jgi:hypothetical protein
VIARRSSLLALSCLVASVAHAAPKQATRAEQLFDEAKKLMQANDYAKACDKLEESQKLDPQLGTQLHLGYCYEKRGEPARAYTAYQAAAELAAQRNASGISEPREQVARERAADLAPQLAFVELRPSEPLPDLRIALDDVPVERSIWAALPVDPGEHAIHASAFGRADWHQVFAIAAAARQIIVVPSLARLPADAQAEPAASSERITDLPGPGTQAVITMEPEPALAAPLPAAQEPSTSVQLIGGYIVAGFGVAALASGIAFGLMRNSKVSKLDHYCNLDAGRCEVARGDSVTREEIRSLHDDASMYATIANIGMIVGGLAVVGGLTLVLTAPKVIDSPEISLTAAPGGLTLTARSNGM